jgi:hypothetical protein
LSAITYEVNFNRTSQTLNTQFSDYVNNTLFPQGLGVLTDALDLAVFESVPPELNNTLSARTRAALAEFPADWSIYKYLPVNSDLHSFRTIEFKLPQKIILYPKLRLPGLFTLRPILPRQRYTPLSKQHRPTCRRYRVPQRRARRRAPDCSIQAQPSSLDNVRNEASSHRERVLARVRPCPR